MRTIVGGHSVVNTSIEGKVKGLGARGSVNTSIEGLRSRV